jgi:hypothetical protein
MSLDVVLHHRDRSKLFHEVARVLSPEGSVTDGVLPVPSQRRVRKRSSLYPVHRRRMERPSARIGGSARHRESAMSVSRTPRPTGGRAGASGRTSSDLGAADAESAGLSDRYELSRRGACHGDVLSRNHAAV